MAICDLGEKLLQEATGIRRGRVYPVANNNNNNNNNNNAVQVARAPRCSWLAIVLQLQ